MDIEALWQKALRDTEIHRKRLNYLSTFGATRLPYVSLSKSELDDRDTIVRRGEVEIGKPLLILPPDYPQFEGFDFEKDLGFESDSMRAFLYMRGLKLPSLKYYNKTFFLDVVEESVSETLKKTKEMLERTEDTTTGLIVAPNDAWQFSLIIYVGLLVNQSLENDIRQIIERQKEEGTNDN